MTTTNKYADINHLKNELNKSCQESLLYEFRRKCKELLLTDLDYSLDKKLEVDLWNVGFKDHIGNLQTAVKEAKKSMDKSKSKTASVKLQWFLESSAGFYLILTSELKSKQGLKFDVYGDSINNDDKSTRSDTKNHLNNVNYLAQHCLVHLGDLSRYRNQTAESEVFYRQAVELSPNSGQAYNQIALLEANRGNKLTSVYFYVRSLSCKYPFPAASSNLVKILERFIEVNGIRQITNCATFIHQFLQFASFCKHAIKLKSALKIVKNLKESLTSLIATESLSSNNILQIISISVFLIPYDRGLLSQDERIIKLILCQFLAGILNSFLLPVYTSKQGDSLINYFALPGIKLILDWISINPEFIKEKSFKKIIPSICRLMNELKQIKLPKIDVKIPLSEENELRGFKFLAPKYKNVNKSEQDTLLRDQSDVIKYLRVDRLLKLGELFVNLGAMRINNETFEVDDIDEEEDDIESLIIDDEEDIENVPEIISPNSPKKAGILKFKEETPISSPSSSSSSCGLTPVRKSRSNNVAMAAILKQQETSEKQVKFQESSPPQMKTTFRAPPIQRSQQPPIRGVVNPHQIPDFTIPPPSLHRPPMAPYFTQQFNSNNSLFGNNGPLGLKPDNTKRFPPPPQPPNFNFEPDQPTAAYSLFSGPSSLNFQQQFKRTGK